MEASLNNVKFNERDRERMRERRSEVFWDNNGQRKTFAVMVLGVVLTLKKIFISNYNTKFHTKSYFIILYIFNFLFVIYLIIQFINKISE